MTREGCSQVESPEEAAREGSSTGLAAPECGSADSAAAEGSSMAAGDEATSQTLERLESAGEAVCCLNDTFEVEPRTRPPLLQQRPELQLPACFTCTTAPAPCLSCSFNSTGCCVLISADQPHQEAGGSGLLDGA